MEGQVTPFAMVCSDITGPLMESVCGSRCVMHFTCLCTKWSWGKSISRKSDLLVSFLEFSNWIASMCYRVRETRTDAEAVFTHGVFA